MADLSIALAPSPAPVAPPKADMPPPSRPSAADNAKRPDPFAKLMAQAKPNRPEPVARKAQNDAKQDDASVDTADEDGDDATEDSQASGDPLGDAIAAGLTAVLALAQPVAPVPAQQAAAEADQNATLAKLALPTLATGSGAASQAGAAPSAAAMDAAQQALAAFVAAANGKGDGSKGDALADPQAAASASDTAAPAPQTAKQGAALAGAGNALPAAALPTASSAAAAAAIAGDAKAAARQTTEAKAADALAALTGKSGRDAQPAQPVAGPRDGLPTQQGPQTGRAARTETRKPGEGAFTVAAFGSHLPAPTVALAPDAAVAPTQSPADIALQQQLDVAQDGQWLDRLAKDIAGAAGSGQDLNFRLSPPNLGTLAVSIAQGTDGAAVRLTTDSADTRQLLIDSQPKLVAEARAQGLKISETHVDLNNNQQQSGSNPWGQNSHSSNPQAQGQSAGQQQRQPLPDRQPFSSNRNAQADSETNGTADSDALYA